MLIPRRFACLSALCATLAACSSTPTERIEDARFGITSEELEAHISFLAHDSLEGRETGTEGCQKAAEYMATQMRAAGLQFAGDFETYMQHFSTPSGRRIQASTSFSVPGMDCRLNENFAVGLGIGRSSGEGELFFVGYGIHAPDLEHDDYAGVNVEGKIVVALSGAPGQEEGEGRFTSTERGGALAMPRAKFEAAKHHGATGMILVQSARHMGKQSETLPRYVSDRGAAGMSFAAIHVTGNFGEDLLSQASIDVSEMTEQLTHGKNHSRSLAPLTAHLKIDTEPILRHSANVIGFLPGQGTQKDEVVILGAHYDHIGHGYTSSLGGVGQVHNGADDNASGCAALLEIAAACSERAADLNRTLVFIAFSGEEMGLRGSSHYTQNPRFPLEKTVAMINLDMIGRSQDGFCAVGPVSTSMAFEGLPEQLAEQIDAPLKVDTSAHAISLGTSDHQSFLHAGIPAVTFFSGLHEDYHRPSDDVIKINLAGTRMIAHLAYEMLTTVESQPQRPDFQRPDLTAGYWSGDASKRPWFGSIPDVAREGNEGLLLRDVIVGSPAHQAGLRSGDVLLNMNGQVVRNLQDFTSFLRQRDAGDRVAVVVQRGGEQIQTEVELILR
jgi:hypothetical protein